MERREFHLHIDGGPLKPVPVRCCGYIDDGTFHIEEVLLELRLPNGEIRTYDIISNLKSLVIARLEADAESEIMWEKA